jgi:hypothetical protein
MHHNYVKDLLVMRRSAVDDEGMTFGRASSLGKTKADEASLRAVAG